VNACGKKTELFLEPGVVIAECTEQEGHEGRHYDRAYGASWGYEPF
jgi:hypothetical protein